jgi:hypothetical protein
MDGMGWDLCYSTTRQPWLGPVAGWLRTLLCSIGQFDFAN